MLHKRRILDLQGVLNARELGGLPLKNGRIVKHNTFIRTGKLSNLTLEDQKVLSDKWNLTKIIDLRNSNEIKEYPDPRITGAKHTQVSIIPCEQEGISREDHGMDPLDRAILRAKKFAEGKGARHLLETMYAQMARDSYCIDKIKEIFDILLEHEEGSILWHCTSGKDRTGVTGSLLLYALGADIEAIKEDYLYTNIQNKAYRENVLQRMRERGVSEDLVYEIEVLESVEWKYMQNFLDAIEEQYGEIEVFLRDKLGLNEEKRRLLVEKYTY